MKNLILLLAASFVSLPSLANPDVISIGESTLPVSSGFNVLADCKIFVRARSLVIHDLQDACLTGNGVSEDQLDTEFRRQVEAAGFGFLNVYGFYAAEDMSVSGGCQSTLQGRLITSGARVSWAGSEKDVAMQDPIIAFSVKPSTLPECENR